MPSLHNLSPCQEGLTFACSGSGIVSLDKHYLWLVKSCLYILYPLTNHHYFLSTKIDPRKHYTQSLYPFSLEFVKWGIINIREAVWSRGQHVRLAIRWSPVQVPLLPLAAFVLGHPKFKSSARLVNSQLVASCQLGYLILSCCICIICFRIIWLECL